MKLSQNQILAVAKLIYPTAVHSKLWGEIIYDKPNNAALGLIFDPHSAETCIALMEKLEINTHKVYHRLEHIWQVYK